MVRIVLFSDIHSAPSPLSHLLTAAAEQEADGLWCLGDLVGYGDQPVQVVRLMRGLQDRKPRPGKPPLVILRGNHDHGISSGRDLRHFDQRALRVVIDQMQSIPQSDRDWLAGLPLFHMPLPGYCAAHGAFIPKVEYDLLWVYGSTTPALAFRQLAPASDYCKANNAPLRLIALGHSHIPTLMQWNAAKQQFTIFDVWEKESFSFEALDQAPIVVNPGSIALPRQGTLAAYVILDIDGDYNAVTVSFKPMTTTIG